MFSIIELAVLLRDVFFTCLQVGPLELPQDRENTIDTYLPLINEPISVTAAKEIEILRRMAEEDAADEVEIAAAIALGRQPSPGLLLRRRGWKAAPLSGAVFLIDLNNIFLSNYIVAELVRSMSGRSSEQKE